MAGIRETTDGIQEQIENWLAGEAAHNPIRDECCPDFSCCSGIENIWPQDVRQKYYDAYKAGDEATMQSMGFMALGDAILGSVDQDKIYLAGRLKEAKQ